MLVCTCSVLTVCAQVNIIVFSLSGYIEAVLTEK